MSNEEPLSKRAMRLASIQGEIGSNEKAKGPIRYNMSGKLEYFFRSFEGWGILTLTARSFVHTC